VDPSKCEHEPCSCPRSEIFGAYCCAACKEAQEANDGGETPLTECQCGHEDCGGVPEISEREEIESLLFASKVLSNA
jgi:hypothetical protein